MPPPVTGVTGPGNDRPAASADAIADARLRHAERLRAAQAENTKPTEVVEETAKSDAAELTRKHTVQAYRVSLESGTGRLYTEVLDTETGETIMRIPAGYPEPVDPLDPVSRERAEAERSAADTLSGGIEA